MLTGLHPKRAGKIGLATSCRTGDKDVPVFGDVLAGRQPLDQVSVDLPVMAVIVMEHIPGYQGVPYVANSLLVLVISFLCCLVGDKLCRKIKIGRLNLSSVIGLK